MRLLSAAIAAALLAAPAASQSLAGTKILAPAGFVPGTAIYCDDGTGKAIVCSLSASGGTASIATAQVSVGTTSTLVAAARTGRRKVTLSVGAANTCAFGNTGVTLTTGFPLQPVAGATVTIDTAAAVYAACSTATTVSYLEQF